MRGSFKSPLTEWKWGLALLWSAQAFSISSILTETERLRDSLSLRDSSRPALTLRLADLYFDEAGVGPNPTQQTTFRRRSIQLYQEAQEGKPSGRLKSKIEFQLARLYQDNGEWPKAEAIFKSLLQQGEFPDLKRESALRLAENKENAKSQDLEEAARLYQLVVDLAQSAETTAYAHYRKAWILRRLGKVPEAVEELKLSLWDSKGQVREEALRDLVIFSAESKTDAKETLYYFESLAEKIARPSILLTLAEAFFSHGNREAGSLILKQVNAKAPKLKHQLRLLEESYAGRQWEDYSKYLAQANESLGKEVPDETDEKLLRRLTVQLDAERITTPETVDAFLETVYLYLKLFPKGPDRSKMADGMIAAQKDTKKKIQAITTLLSNPVFPWTTAEKIKYLELRAHLYGELKDFVAVKKDIEELLTLEKSPANARKYRFVLASANIDLNLRQEALTLFESVAKENPYDSLGTKSHLLTLKISGEAGKFKDVFDGGTAWLKGLKKEDPALTREIAEVRDLKEKSEFEWAVSLGQTPEALTIFKRACFEKRFLPKSCDNAQVIAIHLKDAPSLFALLKHLDKEKELAAEYEARGYFAEAAALNEKLLLKGGAPTTAYLRVALLYELASQNGARDQVLKALTKELSLKSSLGEEAALVRITLKDAGLLNEGSLKLPWSKEERCSLANELALEKETESLREILLKCEDTGPLWTKTVLSKLKKLDEEQANLHFYGKRGKQRFEKRLAALKALNKEGDAFLAKAGHQSRSEIADLLSKSYDGLAKEILSSPIPPEVTDPADVKIIQDSLNEMAQPFSEKAKSFLDLAQSEKAKEMAQASANLPSKPVAKTSAVSLKPLKENPFDKTVLSGIRDLYKSQGQERLASYFQGRMNQLEGRP